MIAEFGDCALPQSAQTVTLTLTLEQLRILDAGLCLIDDVVDDHCEGLHLYPARRHADEAMHLRDTVTAPAINRLNPGGIDL